MPNVAPCGWVRATCRSRFLTNITRREVTLFCSAQMVNPSEVDTPLADVTKYAYIWNPELCRIQGSARVAYKGLRRSPVSPMRESTTDFFHRKCLSAMAKFMNREQESSSPGAGLSGGALLGILPVFIIFYTLLILPFMEGKERPGNMLFWPLAAALTLTLVCNNWARIDRRFFLSLPMMTLIAYHAFAGASITWAYSPDFAFSRFVVEALALIVVVLPYALPISTKSTISNIHLCYAVAFAISAIYVLTTPPSPIGHPGYFTHKQELGLLGAVGIILSSYELLHRGWRRFVAVVSIGLAFWLVFESQSKSALALSLIAIVCSALMLLICKKTRLTPAFIVAAFVVATMFVSNPAERIAYKLYGDATLTGRTKIWGFANYRISQKPWFGWGFHSYYFVPNSPQKEAPGYIRDMPSSHSGYLELKLETGRIGYWIFLVFIYSSLHLLERVRRKDPIRAWFFLSIELFAILINLVDSNWLVVDHFWVLYLIVVAESVRYSWPGGAPSAAPVGAVQAFGVGPRHRRLAQFARSSPVMPGDGPPAS
jgi:exopolysaccharide production protein ExoQ